MSIDSIREGEKRYLKRTHNLCKKKQESKTHYGRHIYKNYVTTFSALVDKTIKQKISGRASLHAADWKLLSKLKSEVIAHLTLKTILDGLSGAISRTSLSFKVGQAVEDELTFFKLRQNHPDWWKKIESRKKIRSSYDFKRGLVIRQANIDFKDTWKLDFPPTTKVHVGLSLLELFRISTNMVEYTKRRLSKRKFEYVVLPTKETLKWIESFNNEVKLLSPYYLPLTVEPAKWTSLKDGGYEFPENISWYFIKTDKKKAKKIYESCGSLETVFDAASRLQSVPFRINKTILEIISKCLTDGIDIKSMKMLPSDTPKGHPEDTLGYRRSQAKKHRERIKVMPRVIQTANLVDISRRYQDELAIYFPVQADFRGRLYYTPALSPQGNDLAKGLLEFANPSTVQKNEHWFLIGGANAFGIKGSFDDRQKWVLNHEKHILETVDNPIGYRSFWEEASDPLPFLAWCFEFGNWIANRHTFQTRLPVRLDHTASGLQIVALLKQDEELMRLTNLVETDEPSDIYRVILNKLKDKLLHSPRPESHAWQVDRKLVKLLTVSYMYGGTSFGLERTIVNWYTETDQNIFGREIYKECRLFIKLFLEALNEVSPTPAKFISETHEAQGKELLSWTSPSGFPVVNLYYRQSSTLVRTSINNERVCARVNTPNLDKLHAKAARQALPANRVHAYDSAILHKLLTKDEWPDILSLHDCYGVPPRDCQRLQQHLAAVLEDIFRLDMPTPLCYAAS